MATRRGAGDDPDDGCGAGNVPVENRDLGLDRIRRRRARRLSGRGGDQMGDRAGLGAFSVSGKAKARRLVFAMLLCILEAIRRGVQFQTFRLP
jgi:hypothetical protein